jgi:biopolymer transport protein ExbD
MAEINIPEGKARKRNRAKKVSVRVDLTPMVDLAFLLITFFMLTTSLKEQKGMPLNEPERKAPPSPVSECQLLNLLTDSTGQIYYWEGLECKAVTPISLDGEHNLKSKLKEKSEFLKHNCLYASGKQKTLVCLVKLMPGSRYGHMVKVLDELVMDSVPTYAIQGYSPEEEKAVGIAGKELLSIR